MNGRLERQSQYLNRLQRKNVNFENQYTQMMLASKELDEQMEALVRAHRKLQFQLKCKSQTSEKIFFGKDAANENDKQTIKMIKILEQKLNGKRNRLSMIQHGNKVLTNQINEVRLQKVAANVSSEKLHTLFEHRQKQMAASMHTANKCNAVRLQSGSLKESAIEEGTKKENAQRAEMEKLKDFLFDFAKENDFLKTVARQKMTERMEKLQNGSLTAAEEKALRKQMASMSAGLADQRRKIKSATDKMFTYETAFKRLKEETQEESIDKIVDIFVSREDENYSLYKYLQRVNESLKESETKLHNVEESIQKYLKDEEGNSNQVKNRIEQIENRRDALQQKVTSTDEKHKHNVFTQNLWASAVEKFVLQILGFSDIISRIANMANPNSKVLLEKLITASNENLDSSSKRHHLSPNIVTEGNISAVLSIVELCVMEIYAEYIEVTTGKIGDFGVRVAAGPAKGNPLNVEVPEIAKEEEENSSSANSIRGVVPGPMSSKALRASYEAQLRQQLQPHKRATPHYAARRRLPSNMLP